MRRCSQRKRSKSLQDTKYPPPTIGDSGFDAAVSTCSQQARREEHHGKRRIRACRVGHAGKFRFCPTARHRLPFADVVQDVEPDGGDVAALRPEPPVAEPVLQVGALVEDHERTLALQVAHHARHAVLRRYRQQHVHMVGHEVPLYYLDALVLAKPPQDLPYVGPDLAVDGLSPILRREHDVVTVADKRALKLMAAARETTITAIIHEWVVEHLNEE